MKTQDHIYFFKITQLLSRRDLNILYLCLMFGMLFHLPSSYAQLDGLLDDLESSVEDVIGGANNKEKKLPSSYSFDIIYTVEMIDKRGASTLTYLIDRKDHTIAMFENEPNELNLYLIDHNRKLSLLYAEANGNKARSFLPYVDLNKMAERLSKRASNSSTIKATGKSKTILGYNCQEYYFKNSNSEGCMYVAHELNSTSDALFGFQSALDPEILKQANSLNSGLLLGLKMHKVGKPQKNALEMECINFEEKDYTIRNSEYTAVN